MEIIPFSKEFKIQNPHDKHNKMQMLFLWKTYLLYEKNIV